LPALHRWTFISSIKPRDKLFPARPSYWPIHPMLAHYQQVLQTGDFLVALGNSVIVAVSVTMLSLVVGAFGAYALGWFRFVGQRLVLYTVLAMTMFAQVAVLGGLFEMINRFGLYNHLLALMITYLKARLRFAATKYRFALGDESRLQ
jgi:trehalose/maltose transport system permease protein